MDIYTLSNFPLLKAALQEQLCKTHILCLVVHICKSLGWMPKNGIARLQGVSV